MLFSRHVGTHTSSLFRVWLVSGIRGTGLWTDLTPHSRQPRTMTVLQSLLLMNSLKWSQTFKHPTYQVVYSYFIGCIISLPNFLMQDGSQLHSIVGGTWWELS